MDTTKVRLKYNINDSRANVHLNRDIYISFALLTSTDVTTMKHCGYFKARLFFIVYSLRTQFLFY